jgi:Protein of unknown function/AsmA-like C-terminal region
VLNGRARPILAGNWAYILAGGGALRRQWVKRAAVSLVAVFTIVLTLGIALTWRLSQGPLSVDFMRDRIQAKINRSLGGMSVRLAGVIIEHDARTGIPHFRLRDLELIGPDGQTIARAPKAAFGVDTRALLGLQLVPRQIELIGPRILVRRHVDGSFELGFGRSTAPEEKGGAVGDGQTAGTKGNRADQEPGFAAIAPETQGTTLVDFLIGALPDNESSKQAIASLDTVLVSDAAIQLYDEANNATWYAPAANLAFKRTAYGFALFADAKIASGNVPWRTEISASYRKETRTFSVSARIFDLVPAEISDEIFALSQLAQVRLPLTGHADVEFSDTGEISKASAELSAQAGKVGFPGYISQPLLIDQGSLRLDYDPKSGGVIIRDSMITIAGTNTAVTGRIDPIRRADNRLTALKIAISARNGHSDVPNSESSSTIDRVDFSGIAAVDQPRLDVDDAMIMAGTAGLRMRGTFIGGDESVGIKVAVRFRELPTAMLTKLWPPIVAPNARSWIEKNISAGRVVDGELSINLPVNALAEADQKQFIPNEMISGRFSLADVTAAYMPQLPVITHASGEARLQGDTFDLTMHRGEVIIPSGGKIALKDGSMHATALLAPIPPAEFRLQASSDVSSLVEYMGLEPINLAPDTGFDVSKLKGRSTVKLELGMPLAREIARSDIKLVASASISDASMKSAMEGIDLTEGDLKLTVDDAGVAAQGPVKINGIPATLTWSREPGSEGVQDAVIETELDEKERDKLGAHVNDYIGGPVKLKVTLAQFRDEIGKAKVEADLSKANLRLDAIGWARPPSAKTSASFEYASDSNGGSIDNLLVKGNGISVKGSIKLTPRGTLDEANFSDIELDDENQFGLRFKRTRDLTSLSISGLSFDARSLIKSMFSRRGEQTDAKSGIDQAYDIRASIDRVHAYRGEIITGVTAKLFMNTGSVEHADIGGAFASGQPVMLNIAAGADGTRELRIGGSDAGAALRAANLYSKVAGGVIDFSARLGNGPDSSIRDGRLVIRDFEVRNEAALAELDRKGKPKSGDPRGDGVAFKQLYLPFTADARFIKIGDTTIKGAQLCATAQGLVRKADGAMDIDGTIVPACGINLLPGQIPLLGWLITGGPNEGLFGLTYALGGTISNPGFRVNPVSAVAPGIFRKLFEYGGSSSGATPERREKAN